MMKNNMTELISWFQLEYPEIVSQMKNCNHHLTDYDKESELDLELSIMHKSKCFGYPESINPYHCESDIWTHSMMVCKQAENASYEIKLAALLHDIGKPDTRAVNPKNGHVSFYNHDAVGAYKALSILKREELGLEDEQIVRVFNLIALHTQIYKLSPEQLAEIKDMSLLQDLISLGKADHEGRFHTKGDAVIPELKDIPFKSQYKEASMIQKEKEVIVLVGPPAAGKSTYVKENYDEHFKVSRDHALLDDAMFRDGEIYTEKDYNRLWKKARQSSVDNILNLNFREAKTNSKVIVDMTHMSKKSRRKTLSHFDNSYKKIAVVFLTDLERIYLQNSKREGKIIDKKVIDKMIRSFYPPTLEEFDEIRYVL